MSKGKPWRERLGFFVLGMVALGSLLLLTGAGENHITTLNSGRFQIAAWATQLSYDSGVVGAFVIDTVSGETKTVYLREYGKTPKSRVVKNDLKKSYSSIR